MSRAVLLLFFTFTSIHQAHASWVQKADINVPRSGDPYSKASVFVTSVPHHLSVYNQHGNLLWDLPVDVQESPYSVEFRSDKMRIILSYSSETEVWDIPSKRKHFTVVGSSSAKFLGDESTILLTTFDGPVIVDAETGAQISDFPRNNWSSTPGDIAISSAGHYLMSINSGSTELWDVGTRTKVATLNGTAGSFSGNEKRFVTVSHPRPRLDQVRVFDTATGTEIQTIDIKNSASTSGTLSADGSLLLVVADSLGGFQYSVVDIQSGKVLLQNLFPNENLLSMDLGSSNTSLLVSTYDPSSSKSRFRILDARTGAVKEEVWSAKSPPAEEWGGWEASYLSADEDSIVIRTGETSLNHALIFERTH